MSTPAVTEPVSAPVEQETPEVSIQERLDHATAPELKTWREKGDIPPVRPAKEAAPAAAVAEPKPEVPEVTEVKPAPDASAPSTPADAAAPPAVPQKKHRDKTKEDTARRFDEILSEVKALRQEKEEWQRRSAPRETPAPQPEAKPSARPEPKIDDLDANGKPKYTDYAQYLADVRKFDREQYLAEVDERLQKADQTRQQTEQQRREAEQQRILGEGLNRKFETARKKHSDFDAVALAPTVEIPPGSVVDVFLLDSDHAGEVAYYLGQHPEILKEFYQVTERIGGGKDMGLATKFTNLVNPMRQHRRLLEIEREVSASPEVPPALKPPANLPPPPTELSARRSAPVDDADAALARGDTASYMRIVNARETKAARR